jgi:hypothetical protein
MATYDATFVFLLTPGGTNQFTVSSQITGASATVDATDSTLAPGENAPVTFDAGHASLNGAYTYLGFESGPQTPGFVTQGPDSNFYLFTDQLPANPGQVYNIHNVDFIVCFLAGTLIATPAGLVAVEDLSIGDLVLTADGRSVPVKWLGRQTVAPPFGIAEGRRPVAIMAGALDDNVPARDLRLTSDHALLLDGVLVQAGALVNGTTIRRIPQAQLGKRFTVFHIETDGHAIILAEATPAETFIDNATRRCFDNYAEYEALFGENGTMTELPEPRAMSARQVPPAIRTRIAQRAVAVVRHVAEAA